MKIETKIIEISEEIVGPVPERNQSNDFLRFIPVVVLAGILLILLIILTVYKIFKVFEQKRLEEDRPPRYNDLEIEVPAG